MLRKELAKKSSVEAITKEKVNAKPIQKIVERLYEIGKESKRSARAANDAKSIACDSKTISLGISSLQTSKSLLLSRLDQIK